MLKYTRADLRNGNASPAVVNLWQSVKFRRPGSSRPSAPLQVPEQRREGPEGRQDRRLGGVRPAEAETALPQLRQPERREDDALVPAGRAGPGTGCRPATWSSDLAPSRLEIFRRCLAYPHPADPELRLVHSHTNKNILQHTLLSTTP